MNQQVETSAAQIARYIDIMAEKQPYLHAVVFPEGRSKDRRVAYTHLTYQQLFEETESLALKLIKEGINKGDRCALMVKPSLDFFILTFSLFKIGAIPILIDPGIGRHYLKRCLNEAEPSVFIGIPKAQIARVLFGWCKNSLRKIITIGGSIGYGGITLESIRAKNKPTSFEAEFPKTDPDDTAAILFTSGSTGQPKGAIYSHQNFMAQVELLKSAYQITPGERDLCTFPLFALFAPALGMTAIIPDMDFTLPAQVDPLKIAEAIDNFGATNLFGSPALLRRVGTWLKENPRTFPSLKRVISAGAPVPASVLALIQPALTMGAQIHTPYGATESLPVASISSEEILQETAKKTRTGSGICVGKPIEGVITRIIKITDDAIPTWDHRFIQETGTVGEIVVTGPHVTAGYYNRPTATKLSKIYDESCSRVWHRMGDLGYLDAKGRIWFCGRKSQRVKIEGSDLYTIACEGIFNEHPKVLRTALVGIGPQQNEAPVLCVETQGSTNKAEQLVIKRELLTLGQKFQNTKDIKTVLFKETFPVDIRHNSKIFREKLKEWATKELNS